MSAIGMGRGLGALGLLPGGPGSVVPAGSGLLDSDATPEKQMPQGLGDGSVVPQSVPQTEVVPATKYDGLS